MRSKLELLDKFGICLRGDGGAFKIKFGKKTLRVIASIGGDWDHVSVSLSHRCPTWQEMDYVKRIFFRDDETVMQLHVPPADHVNYHNYCLHMWRPQKDEIPRPPSWMVA